MTDTQPIAPLEPDVVVTDQQPIAQVLVYPDLVLLTRRSETGPGWRQYPIAAQAVAQAFSNVPMSSGLLPPGTLATGWRDGVPFFLLHVPARRVRIQTPQQPYEVPLPPLVWGGWGTQYRVWALNTPDYPTGDAPLCRCPTPNCYEDGRICWGNVTGLPTAAPHTLLPTLRLFLEESEFNLHLAGGRSQRKPVSILALYEELEQREADTYPLDDLVPTAHTLAALAAGKGW
jgi:PRTRC genetic system protein B